MRSSSPVHARRRRSAFLSALACALACSACATAPRAADQLSPDAVVLTVPIVEQDALYRCGLASVAVLCEYYGAELPAERRDALAKTADEKHGLSGGELRAALEGCGMEVFVFSGELSDSDIGLYRHVDAGRPLIVMTSPGGGVHHYALFLGYDPTQESVCLLDPVQGRVLAPRAVFDRSWERCERFTLLALPAEKTL